MSHLITESELLGINKNSEALKEIKLNNDLYANQKVKNFLNYLDEVEIQSENSQQ